MNFNSNRCHLVYYLLGLLVIVSFGFWLLNKVHLIAGLLAVSILVSYLIAPGVDYLHKRGLPKTVAITIVYLILAGLVAFFVAYLLPVVKFEFLRLLHNINSMSGNLDGSVSQLAAKIQHWVPDSVKPHFDPSNFKTDDIAKKLQSETPALLGGGLAGVFSGVKSVAGVFTGMIMVPLLVFYILMDADTYKKGFLGMLPKTWRPGATDLLRRIDYTLGKYIRGQIIVCVTIGIFVGTALYFLGIDYALLIGVFAGIVDIIPYVGVVIGLVPAFLIAVINKGVLFAIFTICILECIHWLEGHIIVPAVVGHSVGLPPLTVMAALIAGAEVGGVLGMFIAIPLTAILRVIIEFIVEKNSAFGPLTEEDMQLPETPYPLPTPEQLKQQETYIKLVDKVQKGKQKLRRRHSNDTETGNEDSTSSEIPAIKPEP